MKIIRSKDVKTEPASHEDPRDPGVLKKIMLKAGELHAGHIQMVNWATLLPRKSFQNHYHEDMQEIFIMLEDGAKGHIHGKEIELFKGDILVVDPKEHHELINMTDKPLNYVVFGIAGTGKGKSVNVKPSVANEN